MKRLAKCLLIIIFLFTLLITPIVHNQMEIYGYNHDNEKVYVGGNPLGVTAYSEGLIITDYVDVITKDGVRCPAKESGILIGDMIMSIDKNDIRKMQDIKDVINDEYNGKKPIIIKILRNNQYLYLKLMPCVDASLSEYKIGVMAKNDIAGVGTLTYVKQNNRFGALGHRIYDASLPQMEIYKYGYIFSCKIIGTKKGKDGQAGELRGIFNKTSKSIGRIDKNTDYGIYGYIDKEKLANSQLVEVGKREDVKMGKAYIYTSIEGNKPERYSVEIIKNVTQNNADQKGLVIRITDKRLLERTAGIVQGMSGSPIVQNNKLIGAVTHVFLNDSTKGYGVYIDWMIEN